MRKIGTILLLSVLTNLCIADLPSANNAITLSLGGASATYLNAFAIENNVAALAFSKAEFSLNAANRFGLSDYSNIMAVYHHSIENTSIGFSYQVSPLASLTQQKAQVAVARKLNKDISAGVALNYHRFSSTDVYYQKRSTLTFNAGLYFQVNEKLTICTQIFNPNRSELTRIPKERMGSVLKLGTNYKLRHNIELYADALQATDRKLAIHAGVELSKEHYTFRGGFGLNQLVALGFGWKSSNLKIDIAASYHNQLGFSPSLNVGHAF